MDEATATRMQALEDLLGHIVLLLETEPRFTAARMDAWLQTVADAQRRCGTDNAELIAALDTLWQRVRLSPTDGETVQ